MSKYWLNRQQQLYKQLEKDEVKLNKKLTGYYEKQLTVLEKDIAVYYAKYGADDVLRYKNLMLSLSAEDTRFLMEHMNDFAQKYPQYADLMPIRESIYKLNRLEGLQYSMQMQILELGAKEQEAIAQHLSKWAEKSYTAAMGFGSAFNAVNPEIAKVLINSAWVAGANFSDRIWKNKDKLLRYIQEDFKHAIIRGEAYDRIAKQMQQRFGVGKNQAMTLVYTEGTFIMNEAAAQGLGEHYEQYKYSTMGDGTVCDICQSLQGKTFNLKDREPGFNFPPMHTRCRCAFEIVIAKLAKLGAGENLMYPNTQREELGYIDTAKTHEAKEYFGNLIRNEDVENAIVVESSGKVIRFVGEQKGLSMYDVDYTGATLLHNHPASEGLDSFGQDDFIFIRDNSVFKEFIVVNSKYTYTLKVVKDMSRLTYTDLQNWGLDGIARGEMFYHSSFKALAEKGYVKYERKEIK